MTTQKQKIEKIEGSLREAFTQIETLDVKIQRFTERTYTNTQELEKKQQAQDDNINQIIKMHQQTQTDIQNLEKKFDNETMEQLQKLLEGHNKLAQNVQQLWEYTKRTNQRLRELNQPEQNYVPRNEQPYYQRREQPRNY